MLRLLLAIILMCGCSASKTNTDFKCIAACKECVDLTLECKSVINKKDVKVGG